MRPHSFSLQKGLALFILDGFLSIGRMHVEMTVGIALQEPSVAILGQ
jgi:hypothetical protein